MDNKVYMLASYRQPPHTHSVVITSKRVTTRNIINAKKHSQDCIESKNKVDFKNCINNMYDEGYNTVMEYFNNE